MVNLKRIIKEETERVLNEAMGNDFSFKELSSKGTFSEMMEYAEEHLGEPEGKGSSRAVFMLNDQLCLKVAMNRFGVEQNRKEWERADPKYDVLTRVHGHDSEFGYIVSEYALPLESDDIEKILGISPFAFSFFVNMLIQIKNGRKLPPEDMQTIQTLITKGDKLYWQMYDYIWHNDEDTGDIAKPDNLGIVNRDGETQVVILDSGFSEELWQKMYGRN